MVLGNVLFWAECNQSEVTHLIRHGSDHAPLYVACKTGQAAVKKPFRFLNFWCNHHSFAEVVKKAWEDPVEGAPFRVLNQKMKNVKRCLGPWSKSTFGNIFQQIATIEDVIKVKELQL